MNRESMSCKNEGFSQLLCASCLADFQVIDVVRQAGTVSDLRRPRSINSKNSRTFDAIMRISASSKAWIARKIEDRFLRWLEQREIAGRWHSAGMREPEGTAVEFPRIGRGDAVAGCREASGKRVLSRAATNTSCELAPPAALREGQQDTYRTSRRADASSAESSSTCSS